VTSDGVRIAQPHVRFGDPHVTSDDPSRLSIHACLYESLVRRGTRGHFLPGLAHAFELGPDARTWRFRLRNAWFHDGTALTAEDVVYSLSRVRDEEIEGELGTSGVFSAYLAGSRITVSDGDVILYTPTPTADLLDLLVDIPIVSRNFDGTPIGTGPYRLESADSKTATLTRVAESPGPSRLTFLGMRDPQQRAVADVDIAADVPNRAGNTLVATTVCTSFICNLNAGPCQSAAFRRALNYAVDVAAIVRDVLHGAATPLTGPLTERHLGHDPQAPGYPYSPDAARRLLDEAGCDSVLTLDVPTVWPDEAVETGTRVVEYLKAVGLKAELAIHEDRPAYAGMVRAKAIHDAACFDSSPSSTFRVLWEKFHAGHAGPWWQGYADPELDQLIDSARRESDVQKREAAYRRAFRRLSHDAPWIFLYSPLRSFRVHERLAGWRPSLDGFTIFP
jgi:peptide/nickel transport system substrate-binding protein